ncbi:MAG: hypothetical protein D6696_05755 [Acidobacteria bacterium]|nr:MAG: hypothetical protein D6696_05755 [Acidobacteriota bacterium]
MTELKPRRKKMPTAERLKVAGGRTVRFLRDYTAGLEGRDLQRLFDRDAARALSVLAAERKRGEDQPEGFLGFLDEVKNVFLGLSFKLSPARRLLFAASLLLPLFGFVDAFAFDSTLGPTRIHIDFTPLWFLAGLAGMTLLLALELVDRLRVRDELEVARQLQRQLLPRRLSDPPGYRVAHSARTANEIGGDYYDLLPLEDGRMAIAVGDASGHGIAAGLVMAIANAAFKTAVDVDPEPAHVLESVNRVLCRTGSKRAYMSLFYGVLDPEEGRLRYACAGHPYPMLRRTDGSVEELGAGALPLGMRRDAAWSCGEATIGPGETLVLYSDGLPEAIGGRHDDAFGFDRLHRLVAEGGPPRYLHDRILVAVEAFLGERQLTDDLTLLVLARDDRR